MKSFGNFNQFTCGDHNLLLLSDFSRVWLFAALWTVTLGSWDSPAKNTGVDCHAGYQTSILDIKASHTCFALLRVSIKVLLNFNWIIFSVKCFWKIFLSQSLFFKWPYLKAPEPYRTCLQNSVCGPCLPTSHHTDAEILHNHIDYTRNQKDLKVKNIKTTCLINWICSFSGQGGGKGDGHLVTYFSKNQYIYQDKRKTMSSV